MYYILYYVVNIYKYMSFITNCADLKMGEVYFYFAKRKHRKQIEKRGVMKKILHETDYFAIA